MFEVIFKHAFYIAQSRYLLMMQSSKKNLRKITSK